MSTISQQYKAVDRLAKAANASVVPVQDYKFEEISRLERPTQNEGEPFEDYMARVNAFYQENPPVWGITHWDTAKLGAQPTAEQIEAEVANPTIPQAECVRLAEDHIAASFSSFILMDGLKRIGEHKEADTLNLIPKTIAIATWVETVKQTALAGSTDFPPAPHAVVEVLAE